MEYISHRYFSYKKILQGCSVWNLRFHSLSEEKLNHALKIIGNKLFKDLLKNEIFSKQIFSWKIFSFSWGFFIRTSLSFGNHLESPYKIQCFRCWYPSEKSWVSFLILILDHFNYYFFIPFHQSLVQNIHIVDKLLSGEKLKKKTAVRLIFLKI